MRSRARALPTSRKAAASSHALSVRENLVMAARAGADGRRDWTFERVLQTFPRLAERLDHGGAQLSGGEPADADHRRALMTNPDLLILDEANRRPGAEKSARENLGHQSGRIKQAGIAAVIVDRTSPPCPPSPIVS